MPLLLHCQFVDVVSLFCIVFCILNTIFFCISLNNFVIFLVSFPLYVKVVHFVLSYDSFDIRFVFNLFTK
jgi:hypothetical protein